MSPLVIALALGLAAVHLFAGKLRSLDILPRRRWLSFASGISVAYVFVHLLPDVAEGQRALEEAGVTEALSALEQHVWLVALAGLTVFYGLERLAKRSRESQMAERGEDQTERWVFWVHMVSYGLYNALVGYLLLHREEHTTQALLLYWAAMALHFVVNDVSMRQDHKALYHDIGRWLLAASVVGGCLLGAAVGVSEAFLAVLLAFLGGGVVLNVLKEELPEERASRFWPFALGTAAYTALLLIAG